MGFIHININDAYAESQNLRLQSEELEAHSDELAREAEDLMNVWRGASAMRVQEVIEHRAWQAHKISHNLEVISSALYETAKTFDEAIAKEALRLASGKLPLKTKIVAKSDVKPNEAGGESK